MKTLTFKAPLPEHILRMIDFAERKKMGKHFRTSEEIASDAERITERKLHAQIRSLLSLKNIVYFESRMDKRTTQKKGAPDFIFATKGIPVAWECKVGKGKLRPEQEEMLCKMEVNGWRIKVVRSLQEASEALKDMGV